MNAAVGLMDGLGLDGDRCIRVIPRHLHPGDLCQGDSPEIPYTVKSGQYALYWNGFLFYFVIRTAELKTSQNAQIARKVALSGEVCTFSIELTFDLKSFSVGVWN